MGPQEPSVQLTVPQVRGWSSALAAACRNTTSMTSTPNSAHDHWHCDEIRPLQQPEPAHLCSTLKLDAVWQTSEDWDYTRSTLQCDLLLLIHQTRHINMMSLKLIVDMQYTV